MGKEEEMEEDDGPSLADIRNQWRKKVPMEEHWKAIEDEVKNQQDSLLDNLLKKAEQKVNESKSETTKTEDYITEEMNEEISWALEMKKQHAESGKVTSHNNYTEEKKKEEKKELSQFEKMQLLKEKEAEEKKKLNAKPSDEESLANLTKAMEQKSERR